MLYKRIIANAIVRNGWVVQSIKEDCNFSLSDSRDPRAIENQHVVVARGFVDSQEPQGA